MVTPKPNEGDDPSKDHRAANPPGGQEINASDIFRGRAGSTPPGDKPNPTPPSTTQSDGAAAAAEKTRKPSDGRPQLGEHSLEAKREGGDAGPLIHRTMPDRPQGVRDANQAAIENANMQTATGVAKPVTVEFREGGSQSMVRIKADDGRTVLYSRPGADGRDEFFKQNGGKLVQSDRLGQPIPNGESLAVRNIQMGRQFGQPGDTPPVQRPNRSSDVQAGKGPQTADGGLVPGAKRLDVADKPVPVGKTPEVIVKPGSPTGPVTDATAPKGAKPSDSPTSGGPPGAKGQPGDAAPGGVPKGPVDLASGGRSPGGKPGDVAGIGPAGPGGIPGDLGGKPGALDGTPGAGPQLDDLSPDGKTVQSMDGRLQELLADPRLQAKLLDVLQPDGDAVVDPRLQEIFKGLDQNQIEAMRMGLVEGLQEGLVFDGLDPVLQGKLQQLAEILGVREVPAGILDAINQQGIPGSETLGAVMRDMDRAARLLEAEGRSPHEVMAALMGRTIDGGESRTFSVSLDARSQSLIDRLQGDVLKGAGDGVVQVASSENFSADIVDGGDGSVVRREGSEHSVVRIAAGDLPPALNDAADRPTDSYEDTPDTPDQPVYKQENFETLHTKPEDKKHHEHHDDDKPVKSGPTPEEIAMLAQKKLEEENKRKEREEEERRLDKERKDKEKKNKRGSYRVRQGDSLVTIAQTQCKDGSVAPLIYDINRGQIPEKFHGVRRAAWLKVNQVLALPSENDVANYKRGTVRHANIDMSVPAGDTGVVPTPPGGFASPEAELAAKFGMAWGSGLGGAAKPDEEIKGSRSDDVKRKIRENRENIEEALGTGQQKPAVPAPNRIKYVCRIGDTLRSIALRHPALQDVKLWELVAVVNELSTEVNSKNDPIAKLARGQILFLPTPEDIQSWRAGTFHNESSFALLEGSYVEMTRKDCPACSRPSLVSVLVCPGCGLNMDGEPVEKLEAAPVAATPRSVAHSYARDVWSDGSDDSISNTPTFSKINLPSSPGPVARATNVVSGVTHQQPLAEYQLPDEQDDQTATSDNIAGYYEYMSRRAQLPVASDVPAPAAVPTEVTDPKTLTADETAGEPGIGEQEESFEPPAVDEGDLEDRVENQTDATYLSQESQPYVEPLVHSFDCQHPDQIASFSELRQGNYDEPFGDYGFHQDFNTSHQNQGASVEAEGHHISHQSSDVEHAIDPHHPYEQAADQSVSDPLDDHRTEEYQANQQQVPAISQFHDQSPYSRQQPVSEKSYQQSPEHQQPGPGPEPYQSNPIHQYNGAPEPTATPQAPYHHSEFDGHNVQPAQAARQENLQDVHQQGFAQPSARHQGFSGHEPEHRSHAQPLYEEPAPVNPPYQSTGSNLPVHARDLQGQPQPIYESPSKQKPGYEFPPSTYDLQGQTPYEQPGPLRQESSFELQGQEREFEQSARQPGWQRSSGYEHPANQQPCSTGYQHPYELQGQSSGFDLQGQSSDLQGQPSEYNSLPQSQGQQNQEPPFQSPVEQYTDEYYHDDQTSTRILTPGSPPANQNDIDEQSATFILEAPPDAGIYQQRRELQSEPAPPVMPLPPPLPSYLRSNTKRPVPDVIYDTVPAEQHEVSAPHYLSVNARIIVEGSMDSLSKGYRVTLEGLTERWVPMVIYEFCEEVILHHIFDSQGRRRTRRIALPMKQALQLAENDLTTNFHQYLRLYAQGN